jgi:hypothetical protein
LTGGIVVSDKQLSYPYVREPGMPFHKAVLRPVARFDQLEESVEGGDEEE